MKFEEPALPKDWEGGKDPNDSAASTGPEPESDADAASSAALGALLEGAGAGADDDPERRVARLGGQLARLDALNVAGMLAAATEGGGARLADRLEAGLQRAAALSARLRRADALARGAPDAVHARSGAARADANARALLRELDEVYAWLDAPPLRDLDALSEIPLTTGEGRARALAACSALRAALRAEAEMPAARRRLGAVRERLRRLARARDQLAGAVARHVNNLLIHLGNEAAAAPAPAPTPACAPATPPRHHAELLPLAPLMRCLKDMDEKSFEALAKVYCGTWSRAYERGVRAACEAARAAPDRAEELLDAVLALVEALCNAEQDFCAQFFCLDQDGSEAGEGGRGARGGAESRRYMQALFPALEPALATLTQTVEKHDQYGAFVVLACVGRRVLGAESPGEGAGAGGETRWARAALAGAAVSAKRQADRCVAERVAGLEEAARAAARKPKCGVLPFLKDFEELSASCERIFAGGRRADLERWYGSLARAMLSCIAGVVHPRTPRSVVLLENYHALGAALAALRVPALDATRREARARYAQALKAYVTQYFGRPLEKLTLFFEGVSEAVAMGVREEEVCYRAAFSKHELRRVLALYPAHEVRKSLHRLYRTVEKHLSEESGLLQVVWRAMQEEFIAQHRALQARIQACYPAAGLQLPLTTHHILDAFSDIAREH